MLFKNKICQNCGHAYDPALEYCPECFSRDEQYGNQKGFSKKQSYLPIVRQALLFGLRWLGFQLLAIIVEIIYFSLAGGVPEVMSVHDVTVINSVSYFILFGVLAAISFPCFKELTKSFKKGSSWLYGVGYGITLIVASIVYGAIIQMISPISDNANQTAVTAMINGYPLLSILVVGILGPVCEELTYRVGLLSFLSRINKKAAIIITCIVFGLIHFDFTSIGTETFINELLNLPSYIIAGVILSLAYDHKGLSCSMTAHIINNLYNLIVSLKILTII